MQWGLCTVVPVYMYNLYNYIIDPCVVTIEYNFIALCTGFPACIVNNCVFCKTYIIIVLSIIIIIVLYCIVLLYCIVFVIK